MSTFVRAPSLTLMDDNISQIFVDIPKVDSVTSLRDSFLMLEFDVLNRTEGR